MAQNKTHYQNTLPPLPLDCLLPIFKVPTVSLDFSDNSMLTKTSHEFNDDSLLGVPVPLADLTVYSNCAPGPNDIDPEDLKYVPELAKLAEKDQLVLPVDKMKITARPAPDIFRQQQPQQMKVSQNYLKNSTFYRSTDDENIQKQLKNAFGDDIPEGEVKLVKKSKNLCSMMIRQSAESLDPDKIFLMSLGRKFLKAYKRPEPNNEEGEQQPSVAVRAYSVSKKVSDEKGYIYVDEVGNYNIGMITRLFSLSSIPKKDMERERLIATPVKFIDPETEKKDSPV